MSVTWTAPSAGTVQAASTYFVSGGGTCNALATAGGCTVTGLSAGTLYTFQLKAKRATNWTSALSGPFTGTTASSFTVSSASPAARGQNSIATTLTVNGTGFVSGNSTISISGSGLTVGATTFVSATQLTTTVAVASGATTGQRDVVVTKSGPLTATCSNCFAVTAAPTLSAGSPAAQTIPQNTTGSVFNIAGTGFASGYTVTTSDPKYVVIATSFTSSTSISVTVRNDYTNSGNHTASLTITNPDGGSVTTLQVLKNN